MKKNFFPIAGVNTMPLNNKEEQILLERFDDESKNILIERNLGLIGPIAEKFSTFDEDVEDLVSIGSIGLIKCANSYDIKKGNKFSTHAHRCIKNEILKYLKVQGSQKRAKRAQREVSIEKVFTDKSGNGISLLDTLCDENFDIFGNIEVSENKKILIDAIDKLTTKEKKVIQLRYNFDSNEEVSQRETAKIIGISQTRVSQLEISAIKKLRIYIMDSM